MYRRCITEIAKLIGGPSMQLKLLSSCVAGIAVESKSKISISPDGFKSELMKLCGEFVDAMDARLVIDDTQKKLHDF